MAKSKNKAPELPEEFKGILDQLTSALAKPKEAATPTAGKKDISMALALLEKAKRANEKAYSYIEDAINLLRNDDKPSHGGSNLESENPNGKSPEYVANLELFPRPTDEEDLKHWFGRLGNGIPKLPSGKKAAESREPFRKLFPNHPRFAMGGQAEYDRATSEPGSGGSNVAAGGGADGNGIKTKAAKKTTAKAK